MNHSLEMTSEPPAPHHLPADEVIRLLETNVERGLSLGEVTRRQKQYRANKCK